MRLFFFKVIISPVIINTDWTATLELVMPRLLTELQLSMLYYVCHNTVRVPKVSEG